MSGEGEWPKGLRIILPREIQTNCTEDEP